MTHHTQQLLQHVAPGALQVCTYHGAGRGETLGDTLHTMDCVITTYGTLGREMIAHEAAQVTDVTRHTHY
jgi:SNF2-related domain